MTHVHGAQAIARTFDILRVAARAGMAGASLTKIASETSLSKPTARRLLMALEAEGMIEQDPASRLYYIGAECCALGSSAGRRYSYKQSAADGVARLAHVSGDTAFFHVRSGAFSICLLREEGDHWLQWRGTMPSTRRPLGIGAGALAMLAALDDEGVDDCLASNAGILARDYPTCPPDMIRELVVQTRSRGFAVNPGMLTPVARGVGVAVRSAEGVVAAFSIGGAESHLNPERQMEMAPILLKEAELLEQKIRRLETMRAA